MLFFLLFMVFLLQTFTALSLDLTFLSSVYTPDSILTHKEDYKPFFIGDRLRYATCTGAVWFGNNHLAVLNLYGQKIDIYRFLPDQKKFNLIQEINNQHNPYLIKPENLTVSPDNKLLVVCSAKPNAGIKFYSINLATHMISQKPIFFLAANNLVHNIRFTSDGVYLAAVGWDNNQATCTYKVKRKDNTVDLELVYQEPNSSENLKPKGIIFTSDNRFCVIAYSVHAVGSQQDPSSQAPIIVRNFNIDTGMLGEEICRINNQNLLSCCEDIALLNNDRVIVISDQSNDMLVCYPFDPAIGQIDPNYTVIQNPLAALNFPHGMSISPDGKYLVVTNYGDDKFNLYQVNP